MQSKPLKRVARPAAKALWSALILWSASVVAAPSPGRSQPQLLEGTWQVFVTLRNCDTGEPIGGPFQSLLTFAQGGTVTETTANPMFFPAIRGPGHGVWRVDSERGDGDSETVYNAATTAFITRDGVLVQRQTIRQAIQFGNDPDQFTSDASVEFFSPDGEPLMTGCATAVAQRFN